MTDPSMDSLYETMGLIRIVELDAEGRAKLEYQARANMCHSGGVVQGGFVTGWIDAAMAHAAIAMVGPEVTPMTLEIKVSFFVPTRPGTVIAEGWIVRRGRKTCFFEGRLTDTGGTELARASSTVILADRHKVENAAKEALGESK